MFSGCTVPPASKETDQKTNQKASPSVGKHTGVVLVPCCTWNCVPTVIFVGYFQGPWVLFVIIDEFSVRLTKVTSRMVSHDLTAYF